VSDLARATWEPRIERIRKAWIEIEWLAVAAGVRRCAVTVATPEEFMARGSQWAKLGLNALPVEMQGIAATYQNRALAYEPGKPFQFRFVLGKPSDTVEFQNAWEAGDQARIGAFLGYPACCYDFFKHVWVEEGLVDTTWPMALATSGSTRRSDRIEVSGPPHANILWRWLGVRAVSHLPCRFDCASTVTLADRYLQVGREAGFGLEMDWLLEILSWPVQWSALHGIAEIKTPVLKISTMTDATPQRRVVQRVANAYPAEGATGLSFPYRQSRSPPLTQSRGFHRGLDNPIRIVESAPVTSSPILDIV
jgi:hypothetical protein